MRPRIVGEHELPDKAGRRADHHAGDRAREVRALPEEREEDERTECRAEAAPRERDHVHHDLEEVALRVHRHPERHERDRADRETRHAEKLPVRRPLADDDLVEIVREARGGDQELAVGRGHNRRHDRRQEDACKDAREEPAVKDAVDHHHEHLLGVVADVRKRQAPLLEIEVEDETDHRRRAERDRHPAHRDATGALHLRRIVDRHEPDQDVRHAEVAEPPRHARGKADETRRLRGRGVREERLQIRIDLIERVHRRGETARVADDNRRHQDDCDKHQRTLDEVRPAHRHVPAEQRIADDDERADPETERVASHREPEERNRVRNAEGRREELRAAHEPGRRVEREEHEDDDRRDDA